MADGYSRFPVPGELDAVPKSRNRSQTTVGLPPTPSPQKKRASSFYPPRSSAVVDETNPDPFYLEHSLTSTGGWGHRQRGFRDARSCDELQRYFMLSVVKPPAELPVPGTAPRPIRPQASVDRSTLSAVEIEHQLGLQQIGAPPWADTHTEATPDLTPSSSFSSNYSVPLYPETVVKATEQLSLISKHAPESPVIPKYPYWSTPLNRSQVTLLPTEPSSPVRDSKPQRVGPNASSETLTMPAKPQEPSSLRGKPLPSLPAVPRPGTSHGTKKQPPSRLVIETSMISPPSLINPVTLEPHRSHFDQALFIQANECPSPVPSPGPPSPSIDRHPTAPPSMRERPSTSTSEMHPEQSVWESDSDGEDTSLSRKPIDTLKKVRSRVQLRVAKSTPKLQTTTTNSNNTALEKFPTMPDPPPQEQRSSSVKTAIQARTGRDIFRPAAHQTLRLVAPSTTSLVRPRSRRNSAKSQTYGIDRSTAAAAIQAKSRRRQRSNSPETSFSVEREKMCTFCREERSDRTIHHSLTLARPPLYKRVWESLRVLGCHGDITTPRPRKAM
ncbi:hypothetical protein BJX63DRAFT_432135 [Aspergillus granulosus]|uniref:Uncharacterized protein n=1 Tax=Aspergillus granulosus TaxID=176169 RepID=A0ABR4HEB8_9EURO